MFRPEKMGLEPFVSYSLNKKRRWELKESLSHDESSKDFVVENCHARNGLVNPSYLTSGRTDHLFNAVRQLQ